MNKTARLIGQLVRLDPMADPAQFKTNKRLVKKEYGLKNWQEKTKFRAFALEMVALDWLEANPYLEEAP